MTTKKETAKEAAPTFEECLVRLEEIVGKLESGDAPLEAGLTLFEEGVALTRRCHEILATAEQKISRLVKDDSDGLSLELFPAPDREA